MAFDGGFLKKTVDELKQAVDCHIDKIYQPSKDELVFLLRKKGFVKRLLITVRAGSARIHFTESKYENPDFPPNFCMLLRKHLSAAKLIDISQPSLERMVVLTFLCRNEMGDLINNKLICEFIGNQSNVILVSENGKIIDALRRSDVETAKRLILPNALYEPPASLEKINPLTFNIDEFCDKISKKEGELSKNLLGVIEGFSPLICREIERNALSSSLKEALLSVINELKSNGTPVMILNREGLSLDFSYIFVNQYGSDFKNIQFGSYSELLDNFYSSKEKNARIAAAAKNILKLLNNLISRTEKKLAFRIEELKKCENRETFRIYGELLKANLHNIKNGSSFAEVQNYYDENLKTVRIPLNPALSPSKNAEKYFKDYKKTYSAEQTLTELTENDRKELEYFESVVDSISRCSSLLELEEIKEELASSGYIKTQNKAKKKQENSSLTVFTSKEGYPIIVGKNNIQNDRITCRLASKCDLWFHTKNIPGSHVVVFCDGKEVSDETILQAATLAAKNSKAAASSQVPVDYTMIKFVKKPSGAKPGMVVYTTNKTVFVNPLESV